MRRLLSSSFSTLRTLPWLAVAVLAAACGGGTEPPAPGTLGVAVAPTSVSIAAGATGSATATITRGGSFTGTVTLTAASTTTGVTATIATPSLASSATSSALTVAVAGTVAPGTYSLVVTATGSGVTTATSTLSVVVPAPGTLALALAPTSVSIAAGASGTTTATITRGGSFAGDVALTATSTTTGVTATVSTPTLGAGVTSSSVTVAVASTVTAGSYSVTVSAAGTGVTTATATLTVGVVAAGAGSITVTATPNTLTAAAGGAAVTSNVAIVRTAPFTGAVALTATGAPAGLTVAFAPASVTATSSVLSVTAASSTLSGAYPLVIRGAGTGITDALDTVTVTVTGGVSPGVTLSLSPTSGSVAQGANVTTTATITRVGGFTGDVTLSATGATSGVTVTFAPSTLTAGVTSSVVTIAASGTATTGSAALVLSAAGTGITTVTAPYALTVTPPPSVSVALSPASLTIAAGASGSSQATITRGGGFTGAVALSQTNNAPSGVTVSFSPASVATGATTSAITVSVGSGVTAGNYSIIVSAAGTGVTTATATLSLIVTGSAATNVTIAYCPSDAPIWFAYQDGTGSWTRVTPATGTNTYTFPLASGRGGIATVDTVGTGYDLNVAYATTTEFTSVGGTLSLGGCGGKTLTGSVASVGTTQIANISLGYASASANGFGSPNFTLTNVATGAQDLFAARLDLTTFRAQKLIIRRGLDLANNAVIPVLDFAASEAFDPAAGTVTVTGIASDTAIIINSFSGVRGSASGLLGLQQGYVAASGAVAFDGVPSANLVGNELQQISATANTAGSPSRSRTAGVLFKAPGNFSLALGAAPATPTVTRDATGNYSRPRVQQTLQADYNRYYSASFSQSGANRSASIIASTGYVGGGAWDLSVPLLTGVTGWLDTWGLLNGTGIDWSISASGGAVFFLDAAPGDGAVLKSASVSSTTPLP